MKIPVHVSWSEEYPVVSLTKAGPTQPDNHQVPPGVIEMPVGLYKEWLRARNAVNNAENLVLAWLEEHHPEAL